MTAATPHRTAATSPCFEVLLTASLVSSLIMPDSNVVAVSLPAIGRSLAAIFIGILVSVAGMGAVVSGVARRTFGAAAGAAGLDAATAGAAAKRVTSGDPAGMLSAVPPAIRDTLHAAGLAAFADGFAAASLLAAGVAVVACLPAFLLVGREDTAAPGGTPPRPCGIVDCRDPL